MKNGAQGQLVADLNIVPMMLTLQVHKIGTSTPMFLVSKHREAESLG
jgi:hypothetical protein